MMKTMDKNLMQVLDEEIDKSICKLRNATQGDEIRTFITEYEELMVKKSREIQKLFLEHNK